MMHDTTTLNGNTPPAAQGHHAAAVVGPDGAIRIVRLPFAPGTPVDVFIRKGGPPGIVSEGSLHGTILKDVDPFGSAVEPQEWEAIK
jgi:hypothetical protein